MASRAAEQPRDATGDLDHVYHWLKRDDMYLLRLYLPEGLEKEDFRLHVDAGGLLTVSGQGAGARRLHKPFQFQLPKDANLDAITSIFAGAALAVFVPKLRQPDAVEKAPPTQAKDEKDLQEEKTAAPKGVGHAEEEGEDKRKAEAAPPLPSEKANGARRGQDEKAMAEHRANEVARGKVAGAKAAAERTGGRWKERVAAEGLKWAETIGRNRGVIAVAVAGFTLGVLVSQSHRLFSRC